MMSLDSDLGRHLALGNFILDQRLIPTTDILSHTKSGELRPPYEWLTQVWFALANRIAGLDGVIVVCAFIISASFGVVYLDAVQRSRRPVTAFLVSLLAAAVSSLHWLPRPHLITFLFLAIWLAWLERVRQGKQIGLWRFPALMLLWANAHGGFIFGMLAWLAYFTGWLWETVQLRLAESSKSNPSSLHLTDQGKKLALIGLFAWMASIATPSLWGNWQAVLNNNSIFILSRTVETRPPDLSQTGTWPFVLLLLLTWIAGTITWLRRKSLPPALVFLLAGFSLLALGITRNIPLFALSAAPVLAEWLAPILEHSKRWKRVEANVAALERPLQGAVWPILIGVGLALFTAIRYQVHQESRVEFDSRLFPVAAATWLIENPPSGNMFNDINWGGYLLYRLWPGEKVFVDSQTDFYGEQLMREYEHTLLAGSGWNEVLERYDVKWVILPPNAPLAKALKQEGWALRYNDSVAIILAKEK